jgi:phosphatidyl-myo-inositol dimannoside synthase
VDVLTYLGEYFRLRLTRALSPAAAARMVRLTPGVDNESFRPGAGGAAIRARLGIAPEAPVVLCVSRMVPRKGQDTLIRAWPRVLAARAGATAPAGATTPSGATARAARSTATARPVLLLVGDGPYAAELRRLARRQQVSDSVIFAGSVPWEDLPAYYDAGTIFAMPCRTRRGGLDVEGLGIVYLEASATGLPVIGGDSGGAPDAILPGETGHVVGGRDRAALEQRLIELLSDPLGAATMGEKGTAWIDREWRWDIVADRLREILAG